MYIFNRKKQIYVHIHIDINIRKYIHICICISIITRMKFTNAIRKPTFLPFILIIKTATTKTVMLFTDSVKLHESVFVCMKANTSTTAKS